MTEPPLDAEIIDFVKDVSPSGAFLLGFNEYAGKLFIASDENIAKALRRARELRKRARTELQRKILDCVETQILFDEPQPVLDDMVGTIFVHLVKEKGVNDKHMLSLLDDAVRTIDACSKRYSKKSVPIGVKALTLYRMGGVMSILGTVKGQTKSPEVKKACDRVMAKAQEYVKMFALDGFGNGEFPNVERIFKEKGFDLGRSAFYERALSKAYDYPESPDELERKAIGWIDEELPDFKRVTAKLAKQFGCKADPEEVEKKINARMPLDPKQLLKTTAQLRRVVQRFANESVHGINPKYNTTLIETPDYLSGMIPTGAAQFFDTYTKKPYQYFFQTTDPKRDPDKSVAGLINLLVHEEYGHCVHHSNSVVGYVGKISRLQMFPGFATGGPITEGLSFNREIEFLEASKKLEGKKRLTKVERDYVKLLDGYGGFKQVNLELEFSTRKMRIVRFLRVVGDVRVNTGKQGLIEFVDWANRYTGVPRSNMYFQLFPAHEGAFPGYATNYAVMGQEIRAIERKIKDDRDRYKFSTYLCSIGFPPRSMYTRMLKDYAKSLK